MHLAFLTFSSCPLGPFWPHCAVKGPRCGQSGMQVKKHLPVVLHRWSWPTPEGFRLSRLLPARPLERSRQSVQPPGYPYTCFPLWLCLLVHPSPLPSGQLPDPLHPSVLPSRYLPGCGSPQLHISNSHCFSVTGWSTRDFCSSRPSFSGAFSSCALSVPCFARRGSLLDSL